MSSSDSDTARKHLDVRRIRRHPRTAQEHFERLAHLRVRCGPLLETTQTHSAFSCRVAHLWPALCERRDPKKEEVVTRDGEYGEFMRGFVTTAAITYSTGPRGEMPRNNPWQGERLRELASYFRDVALSYVNFAVSGTIAESCEAFFLSVLTTLSAAQSKIDQLDVDLAFKTRGQRASLILKASTQMSVADYPEAQHGAIKSIMKLGEIRPRDSYEEDPSNFHQGGFRGMRGGGGRGGRGGGRGRGGPGTPGWINHVPGICSKCTKPFTGLYRDHKCA